MSLSVSQHKGVTVITITSDPKSNWPILCQILDNVCNRYMPAFLIPQEKERNKISCPTALVIVQIVAGIFNIIAGILFVSWGIHDHIMMWKSPFWLGAVFLISGIVTIVPSYCPGYVPFAIAVILNEFSGVLAMIAAGLYSWDLQNASHYINSSTNTTGRRCVDVVMIGVAVLQFCMNVTFIVSSLRDCFSKASADDSQVYKQLPEETTGCPA